MIVHPVAQGSVEWLLLRCGIPTASEFDSLITPLWKQREGQGVETYLYRKLAEKCMGTPILDAGSFAMEQGTLLEDEAIPYVAFMHNIEIKRVGFLTTDDGRIGCSPDGLIGEDGGIEIKCPRPDTALKYLVGGVVPKEYLAQVHGSMLVTGRKWWKFLSYSSQFPPLLVHVERDEKIQTALRYALEDFLIEFESKLAKINLLREADGRAKTAEATA